MTVDSAFQERVLALHRELGIPVSYAEQCGLPLYPEPEHLVATEADYYGRPQRLVPEAFRAWTAMKQAAAKAGVTLHLISAFRDVQYQCQLIRAKLEKGQCLEQILSVNAAPGFSEHHSGRAIDVGTDGCPALVEEFENTEAYQWLVEHAQAFGFRLSYPRDNPHGIAFEPWHWCFKKSDSQAWTIS